MAQRASMAGRLLHEADSLQDNVYFLKRQANACRPISALPTEVLYDIVYLVAELEPPSWTLDEDEDMIIHSYAKPGWLSLQAVCRDWRDLCLGTHDLRRLVRSRDPKPLSITIGSDDRLHSQSFYLAPPLAACLRNVRFHGLHYLHLSDVLDFLRHTPSLYSLDLDDCRWDINTTPLVAAAVPLVRLERLILNSLIDADDTDVTTDILGYLRCSASKINLGLGLYLEPLEVNLTSAVLGSAMSLVARCIAPEGNSLCVHIGRNEILMTHLHSHNCRKFLALLESDHNTSWQASIKEAEPKNFCMLNDFGRTLNKIPRDKRADASSIQKTNVLSVYVDQYSPHFDVDALSISRMFALFANIRVLHLAGTVAWSDTTDFNPESGILDSNWELPTVLRLLSEEEELPVPRLQQLWLGPISLQGPSPLTLLFHLLQRRVERSDNAVRTIYVDIPRPSASFYEEAQAIALEQLIPSFTWRPTD